MTTLRGRCRFERMSWSCSSCLSLTNKQFFSAMVLRHVHCMCRATVPHVTLTLAARTRKQFDKWAERGQSGSRPQAAREGLPQTWRSAPEHEGYRPRVQTAWEEPVGARKCRALSLRETFVRHAYDPKT